MTYVYKPKKDAELERIAEVLLDRFPDRRMGHAVDIEGIIEDLGVDILPRRGLRRHVEGYLASDPRYIVVDETIFSYMPRARFTLAEEICHLILEYKLWADGVLPIGAKCHELDEKQHILVERNAKSLAALILMPNTEFESVFCTKLRELKMAGLSDMRAIEGASRHTADAFDVSPKAAGYKAIKMRIIDKHGNIR